MRRVVVIVLLLGAALTGGSSPTPTAQAAGRDSFTTVAGTPVTLDPAHQSDIGSAAVSAQLFESLTAFDHDLVLRPALAASWDVGEDGRRVVFHLRPGLEFSDGSPLTGTDVAESWLRIIDPAAPSALASLFLDVKGATDYLAGRTTRADVGVRADGLDVIVDLERPGADFPAIVSSATFGVVPPATWRDRAAIDDARGPWSGAYVIDAMTPAEITLRGNPSYWAGPPAIGTVHLLADIGGRSPVAAFEDGSVDFVGVSSADVSWLRYDRTLGPDLRLVPSLSLTYIGFTADRPPFDDPQVRRAFGAAVDWARITTLAGASDAVAATSMVPPGIPGAGNGTWLPAHDPDAARRLLAEAGYPGGAGFPDVAFAAGGVGAAEGIATDLRRELGVTIRLEELDDHFGRLQDDPPAMWSLGWVADYPGPNDFLGVLLGTGSTNNYGRWSSPAFDDALAEALGTRDAAVSAAAFARALGIVRDEVPVVPLEVNTGWALARDGLLGAGENGLGILRIAGLAWK